VAGPRANAHKSSMRSAESFGQCHRDCGAAGRDKCNREPASAYTGGGSAVIFCYIPSMNRLVVGLAYYSLLLAAGWIVYTQSSTIDHGSTQSG